MTFDLFVGFDTGCDKLNWHALNAQEVDMGNGELANTSVAIDTLAFTLTKQNNIKPKQILICIEDTGVYSRNLAYRLHTADFSVWLQDAGQINRSIGRVKTKTDELDAFRIARYALRNKRDYEPFTPLGEVMQAIKSLSAQRKRLQKAKNLLKVPIAEERKYAPSKLDDEVYASTDTAVRALEVQIKRIERQIDAWIAKDERYSRTMEVLQSFPAIGPVTARMICIKTDNFSKGYNPRPLCSLFGIAPHEKTSGKCLNLKGRTHPNVDREVKACLYMGLLSQIHSENKLGRYYAKKIGQGKHHNSVINAMANKLIKWICACLKKDVMYDEKHVHVLA